MYIKEGDVNKVACASSECIKAERKTTEAEVSMVVSEHGLLRWKWLVAKKAIEKGKITSSRTGCYTLFRR